MHRSFLVYYDENIRFNAAIVRFDYVGIVSYTHTPSLLDDSFIKTHSLFQNAPFK